MMFQSLHGLGGWLRGTRQRRLLRRALSAHGWHDDAEREAALLDLVSSQLAPWRQRPPPREPQALELLHGLNERFASIFIFDLRARQLDVWRKPTSRSQANFAPGETRMFRKRVNFYRTLLSEVARLYPNSDRVLLAVDLSDTPLICDEWPIFGFQKRKGSNNLLLPDVDFFHHEWYVSETDPLRYEDKSITACFVGSSTGVLLDEAAVRQHASPRLQLAFRFLQDNRVTFRIAHATQCDSENTSRLLMAQPYFSAPMSWSEQLQHRFLLSVDGNGATCSRVVKSLWSQSVLVKFRSDHELYYFPLLQAGDHYLEVDGAEQVAGILDAEALNPGCYAAQANAGRVFAERYLSAPSVLKYTQLMLQQYGTLLTR